MYATVIDTLRFANRLKRAGVDPRQAEAMSSAFNDEISEGVATKRDLDIAVTELKGEMAERFAKVDARLDSMDTRFEAMDAKFEARFEAMDAKFEAGFEAMDAKFESLAGRFGTQSRYTFLVLALIAALGLYNAAAPHFMGNQPGTAATARPAPAS